MFAILPSSNECMYGMGRRRRSCKAELYCQYCQRRFNKSYNLMVHERSHDIINFSCETCGKSFKSKDALRQHRSQHSPGGSSTGSNSSSSSSSSYSSSPNYY